MIFKQKWQKFSDSSFWNVLTCFFTLYHIIVNLNVLDKIRYLRTSTIWLILTLAMFDRFEELHKVFCFSHLSVWNQQKIFNNTHGSVVMPKGKKDEHELNKHQYVIITFENICMYGEHQWCSLYLVAGSFSEISGLNNDFSWIQNQMKLFLVS